ncbi:MAG: flagellar protein FlgN [Thermoguttaceae bacterium]|nr:flagellar protein FlgN [Thermoguttaceae bacterium]MDW8038924.1 flagellar export chaperone FlgN [Thermoguttaceae bacterium]
MQAGLEAQLAELLGELLDLQQQTLGLLEQKRQMLERGDLEGLAQTGPPEQKLLERWEACLRRREELLAEASAQRLPAQSLERLAAAMPKPEADKLGKQVKLAKSQARLLQHQALTNWVVIHRCLLHLSQLLEILATGGQEEPTYGKDHCWLHSGALVDQEV